MMIFKIIMTVLGFFLAVLNLVGTVVDKTPGERITSLFQALVFAGLLYLVWFG